MQDFKRELWNNIRSPCRAERYLDEDRSPLRGRMTRTRSNIVLIGMPGSGKSTVGIILAKQTARDFIDTDVIIQTLHGRSLQDIVDKDGYVALRRIEEEVLLGLSVRNHVIATGGSAVYSDAAMSRLRSMGIVVFLHVDLPVLESRVHDMGTRGLAKSPDQSFAELYEERLPLYRRYTDVLVKCARLTHEGVSARIVQELREKGTDSFQEWEKRRS